jgi:hypothetical protein
MSENEYNLYPCAHCQGSGTCATGKEGESCCVCIKESKSNKDSHGIVCSVCGGLGLAELKTDRINKRVTSFLAILIAYFALIMVFVLAVTNNKYFSEALAFSGTLIGGITGFYFSSKLINK